MNEIITINQGVPQITKKWNRVFKNVIAKLPSRYAIDRLSVTDKKIVATDGRQLICVNSKKKIDVALGLYILTQEGYLICDTISSKYPEYQSMMDCTDRDKTRPINLCTNQFVAMAQMMIEFGWVIDWELFRKTLLAIDKLSACSVEVHGYSDKKKSAESPVIIEFSIENDLQVFYVMMPSMQGQN
jgi:hypothetical protein